MHRRCCQQAASSVHYTTSCKHRLVLLRMGEIIAQNMLSWLKLLMKLLLLHPVGCLYESESNENPKYIYFLSWTIWCADPWLISGCAAISFTVTRRFSFTMASTAAMASGVTTRCAWPGRGESVTELMSFMNFLVHSYTCCSDRHASPYWFIRRWISMGFTPSLLKKKGWQKAVLLWCILQAGPPALHYHCADALHSCIVLSSVGLSSNHEYHYCQLTRQSSCVSNFYSAVDVFNWLSLVLLNTSLTSNDY